jgi:hypothetical protein
MAKKTLGSETLVSSMLRTNSVLIEVGGSVRRIKLEDFMNAINAGDEQLLRQVAWGVPIKHAYQTSTNYGRIGNLTAWEEYKSQSGRYLVTPEGRAAKLHPNSSFYYSDGTRLDEGEGNVMFISPRLYYRVQTDSVTGLPVLWMSQLPIGGHYIGNAHGGLYNVIGAYKGNVTGSALVSRSNVLVTTFESINGYWNAAQYWGGNWGLVDYNARKLMVMLGLSEYGDTNIQARLGYGIGGSTRKNLLIPSLSFVTGATRSLGDNFGNIPIVVTNGSIVGDNCSRVNLMGIEDPYGWLWEIIQGVYFGSTPYGSQFGTEIFLYEGNRIPTEDELGVAPQGKYRQLVRPTTSNYIQRIILGEYFDIFPVSLGGNSTSYWADYFYGNDMGSMCMFGGGSDGGGSQNGLFSIDSMWSIGDSEPQFSSRLAYYGMLNFVNGKDI